MIIRNIRWAILICGVLGQITLVGQSPAPDSWPGLSRWVDALASPGVSEIERIRQVQQAISTTPPPQRYVLHVLYADLLYAYYNIHSEEIYEDPPQTENRADVRTWGADSLIARIDRAYQQGLSAPEILMEIPARNVGALLRGASIARRTHPTLWDVMLDRALAFYGDPVTMLGPEPPKLPAREVIVAPDVIIGLRFPEAYASYGLYRQLALYQSSLCRHQKAGRWEAYVAQGIAALKLLTKESKGRNKAARYSLALSRLLEEVAGHPAMTEVQYELARLYSLSATQYDPLFSQDYQKDYLKARELCTAALAAFPETLGAQRCRALMRLMEHKYLGAQVENINLPDLPFRLRVVYRNLSQVYLRILPFSPALRQSFRTLPNDSARIALFRREKPLRSWSVLLPAMEDFHFHSTELPIEALPAGEYLIMLSDHSGFSTEGHTVAYTLTQVSDLYLHEVVDTPEVHYFALHRETGFPIPGVEVSRRPLDSDTPFEPIGRTDGEGKISFPLIDHARKTYGFSFSRGNDSLTLSSSRISPDLVRAARGPVSITRENRWYYVQEKSLVLPPTGPLRAGAMLPVRGFFFQDSLDHVRPLEDTTLSFKLLDPQAQRLEEVWVAVEEAGIFSGELEIPAGWGGQQLYLSGPKSMTPLQILPDTLPGFGLWLSPITRYFQLGDSVHLEGYLAGWSEKNLAGASVAYEIKRTVRFPHWESENWWRRAPGPDTTQYEKGTLVAGLEGDFTLAFQAMPDISIDPALNPVYDFWIELVAIAPDGETRTFRTLISVGVSNLQLRAEVRHKGLTHTAPTLTIQSAPVHGPAFVSAGTVSLLRLAAPKQVYRKRQWYRPEFQVMADTAYRALFSHDPYAFEHRWQAWPVRDTLFSEEIDIYGLQSMELPAPEKPGFYKIVVSGSDSRGQTVHGVQPLPIIAPQADSLPFPEVLHVQPPAGVPTAGDTVSWVLRTSVDSLWVHVAVFEENIPLRQQPLILRKGRPRVFRFLLPPGQKKGLGLSFSSIYQNQPFQQFFQLPVSPPNPGPAQLQVGLPDTLSLSQFPGIEIPPNGAQVLGLSPAKDPMWDSDRLARQLFSPTSYWRVRMEELSVRPTRRKAFNWNPRLPLQSYPLLKFGWVGPLVPETADQREQYAFRNLARQIDTPPPYETPPARPGRASAFTRLYENPESLAQAKMQLGYFPKTAQAGAKGHAAFAVPPQPGNYTFHTMRLRPQGGWSHRRQDIHLKSPAVSYLTPPAFLQRGDRVDLPIRVLGIDGRSPTYRWTFAGPRGPFSGQVHLAPAADTLIMVRLEGSPPHQNWEWSLENEEEGMHTRGKVPVVHASPKKAAFRGQLAGKEAWPPTAMAGHAFLGDSAQLTLWTTPLPGLWAPYRKAPHPDLPEKIFYVRQYLQAWVDHVFSDSLTLQQEESLKHARIRLRHAYQQAQAPYLWEPDLLELYLLNQASGPLGDPGLFPSHMITRIQQRWDAQSLAYLARQDSLHAAFRYARQRHVLGGVPDSFDTAFAEQARQWATCPEGLWPYIADWASTTGRDSLAEQLLAAMDRVNSPSWLADQATYSLSPGESTARKLLPRMWAANVSPDDLLFLRLLYTLSAKIVPPQAGLRARIKMDGKKYSLKQETGVKVPANQGGWERIVLKNRSRDPLWWELSGYQAPDPPRVRTTQTWYRQLGPDSLQLIQDLSRATFYVGDTLVVRVKLEGEALSRPDFYWRDYFPAGAMLLDGIQDRSRIRARAGYLLGHAGPDAAPLSYQYRILLNMPGTYRAGAIQLMGGAVIQGEPIQVGRSHTSAP